MTRLLFATVVLACALPDSHARACGGLVQEESGSVAQSGQLSVLSVVGDHTDVILTLDVPDAGNAFGVIVPVPEEPVIDSQPVSTDALTALDEATRPTFFGSAPEDDAGGCGCPAGAVKGDSLSGGDVQNGDPIDIGAVTAQWVAGAGVADWLSAEGFVLPAGGADLIDAYSNAGMSFLVFTRSDDGAQLTGATRVGVRFTLSGDRRAYAMKMTTLGAADEIAFTILVATAEEGAIGPDAPYQGLALEGVGSADARADDYRAAVRAAVDQAGGKAFVVETNTPVDTLPAPAARLFPEGHHVTRLSTVARAAELDADATFTSRFTKPVATAALLVPRGGGPRVDVALTALACALLIAPRAGRRL